MHDDYNASVPNDGSDVGELISQFVEERVDAPQVTEGELWIEAVAAGLFTVGFHVAMRHSDVGNGAAASGKRIDDMIGSMTACASAWASARVVEGLSSERGGSTESAPISFDYSPLLRARLVMYFNEAIAVVADKGSSLETARSHSCFVGLEQIATQLITRGILGTAEQACDFMHNVMAGCDAMTCEIVDALEKTSTDIRAP